MPPVWFSFIAPELLCKSYMITTSLYALHYISGFFLIMSPAEGLHFSALVCYPRRLGGHGYSSLLVCLFVCLFVIGFSTHLDVTALRLQHG